MDEELVRILSPEACDGVIATKKAFKALPFDIRQNLSTQFTFDEQDVPVFSTRDGLAASLLQRIVTAKGGDRYAYTTIAALRQALRATDRKEKQNAVQC